LQCGARGQLQRAPPDLAPSHYPKAREPGSSSVDWETEASLMHLEMEMTPLIVAAMMCLVCWTAAAVAVKMQ
jgi:hypothetical protein